MKRSSTAPSFESTQWFFLIGWLVLMGTAYGRLILHPGLHTACPENDTWNLPIRWSVLHSLRDGKIPLWNSLSAFGIPWLATWQTECFYPGTLLFTWLGLSAWNVSGLLHLSILSLGIFSFLKKVGVNPFWAFCSSAVALLNACAYNHLGSNSSMDTMVWIPWMLLATLECLEKKPWGTFKWTLFFALQVFAGYPQILFYTLICCFCYALVLKGWPALGQLLVPFCAGLLFSAVEWIPSIEYFFLNSVRLPAVHDNPHFFLPMENLKTFLDFNALGKGAIPDYVLNPTFFYFNFYSGFLPLLALILGFIQFRKLKLNSRFFLVGFFLLILWSLGFFLGGIGYLHLSFPAFLEPAKCWVLINVFELLAVGLILGDVFPSPPKWKWAVLALAALNLFWPVWNHPLERNLAPSDLESDSETKKITNQLGASRVLILPDAEEHQRLYTPLPSPEIRPLFKHFIPNSNLFANLKSATFYGSTQPSWGSLDAGLYFQYGFPYSQGSLMDMLGIDYLLLPSEKMPLRFKKIQLDGTWVLWQNPSSLGSHFFFTGAPQIADRKDIFNAFARGKAKPLQDLYLDTIPISRAPLSSFSPISKETYRAQGDYLIVTQNATPGWRAWVDGTPQDIFLADGIFQAIRLKKPALVVDLAYEPTGFRFGLFLSLLALMGFLGWLGTRKSGGFNF